MMKILITGGAGFIGSEIVEQLSRIPGYEIRVLDSLSEQIHGNPAEDSFLYQKIKGKCHFIKGDIRDCSLVSEAVRDVDCIIHLAAETGTGQSMYQINDYNSVNIMGTSHLFQAISDSEKKVRKMILASSRSVYGEGAYACPEHGTVYPESRKKEAMLHGDFQMYCPYCKKPVTVIPTNEDSPVTPYSLYAFTKYAQEKMVETMCRAMEIDYTIFRLQNVYGAGQSLSNPYTGILSIFSELLLSGKALNIFEDGKESRDFIHVRDVASAIIKAIDCPASSGNVINLGSGRRTSVLEIARLLKTCYGSCSELKITGNFRIGDIAHNTADIALAEKLLGFAPQTALEQGMKEFTDWVKTQEHKDLNYEESLAEMKKREMFIG